MLLGGICKGLGSQFDWTDDASVSESRVTTARQLPVVYDAWFRVQPGSLERTGEIIAEELSAMLTKTAWTRERLITSISSSEKAVPGHSSSKLPPCCCAGCGDDYSMLSGIGLAAPRRILSFEECKKTRERSKKESLVTKLQ